MPHPFRVLRVFCVPDGSAGKGCGLRSRLYANPCGPPLPSRSESAGVLNRSRPARFFAGREPPFFATPVTTRTLFHSPSLKITSAFYSSVVISNMIRHATLPSRLLLVHPVRLSRRAPHPLAVVGPSFLTSSISFSFCFLRTLPFSVPNVFRSKLFSFNPFRTLSEKQGGGYQLFPNWNSKSSPRHADLHPPSSNLFPFCLLRTLWHNGRSTTPFDSSASALFLSQRGCRGVALVFLTKGISKGTIGLPNQNPGLPLLSSRSARLEFTPVISTGAQPSSSLPNIEREPLSARSGAKKNHGSRRPQRREAHAQGSRRRFQQLPQQLAPGVKTQGSPVKISAARIRVTFIVRLRSSR